MNQTFHNRSDTDAEVIATLTAISQVSARMAKNLRLNQPVQVIDLACGEQIPKEILLALEDECVIKWAFNATFERICLSRFLGYPTGEYLKPESWRCSMIWSATMGLPLSLEGVTNQKAL